VSTSGGLVTTALWVLPLAAALLLAVLPWSRTWTLAVGGLALFGEILLAIDASGRFDPSGGVQLQEYHPWVHDLGISYQVGIDGLSLVLVALVVLTTPMAVLFAVWAGRERLRPYIALVLALQSALVLLFVARDLVLFYIAFEAMLIPLAFLISGWGGAGRSRATLLFVIYTLCGSLLMLIAIISVGLASHSFDLAHLKTSNSTWLFLAFMAAFAIKAPLYPLHGWVPSAYRESSPEVAGLLSGIVSKAGLYGMLRLALPIFPQPAANWRGFFIVVSLAGLLWCSLIAFRQPDSRGVIAYSSIAQASMIALGIFVLNDQGATGAAFQMVNHGLLSMLLFLLAGIVEVRFGVGLFRQISGLAWGRPALATFAMATGVAALAVPGSALFASEFLVLLGAFEYWWLIGAVASVAIVLAAMYMLRWISAVLHDPPAPREPELDRFAPALGWGWVYLVPLVAAVVVLSVYPYGITHRVDGAVHALTAPAAVWAGR
jgi:NADH-quinone oxidoreductase subunit M